MSVSAGRYPNPQKKSAPSLFTPLRRAHISGMTDMDSDSFYRIARQTIDSLPEPFRVAAREVVLRVEDWPSRDILDDMGIHDPHDLTGLYEGTPLTVRSVTFPSPFPDTIWLFRQPILTELRDRGNISLEELVTHVTIHELAHHFGWSDDDIATIDKWWE